MVLHLLILRGDKLETLSKQYLQNNSLPADVAMGTAPTTEKVLQFGEGNFLRGFIDFFIDELNEKENWNGSIVAAQPIAQGMAGMINDQDGLYTMILRGLENNKETTVKRVVTSINRCLNPYDEFDAYIKNVENPDLRVIISNTTEAGITYGAGNSITDMPPATFPAKVTQFLHKRYTHFNGNVDKGFIFIPCELIDNSGDKLKEVVLQYAEEWNLGADFITWITESNYFCNTLVDRIVTGYPRDEVNDLWQNLGYQDNILNTAEIFHFFVIEAPAAAMPVVQRDFPLHKVSDSIIWTTDATPYKQRKVRILNGAHTMSVLAAYLYGHDTVGQMMDDEIFVKYLKKGIFEEIIPTLDLDKSDLESFANAVFDRFANPFIKHYLLSISLNSVSKYRARVLPSLLEYNKRKGELPTTVTFSLAALIAFYKNDKRGSDTYELSDDAPILDFFKDAWAKDAGNLGTLVQNTLARDDFWGQDLNKVAGLTDAVTKHLTSIMTDGIQSAVKALV